MKQSKFKVGDIVRRTGRDFHQARHGEYYEVLSITIFDSLILKRLSDGVELSGTYDPEYFREVEQFSTVIRKINNELNG